MDLNKDMEAKTVWLNHGDGAHVQGVVVMVNKKYKHLLSEVQVTFIPEKDGGL